jgi:hypothetical protein
MEIFTTTLLATAFGHFPIDKCVFAGSNSPVGFFQNFTMPVGRRDLVARKVFPKRFHEAPFLRRRHLLKINSHSHNKSVTATPPEINSIPDAIMPTGPSPEINHRNNCRGIILDFIKALSGSRVDLSIVVKKERFRKRSSFFTKDCHQIKRRSPVSGGNGVPWQGRRH